MTIEDTTVLEFFFTLAELEAEEHATKLSAQLVACFMQRLSVLQSG